MKKLVIKTTFITIIAILAVCIIVMSAICAFKPRNIGKMFENLGNYEASQYFYQRQYEKTQEIEDLILLIDNAYEKQDNDRLVVFVKALIKNKDFYAYCQSKNAKLAPNQMTTEEYYFGVYVELSILDGNFSNAIKCAKSYVVKGDGSLRLGYTTYNPFRILVNYHLELSTDQKQTLVNVINGLQGVITDSTQLGYMQEDLNKLN